MTISRLAFALDDLEQEIRSLGGEPAITLKLDVEAYDRVVSALADHFGAQIRPDAATGTARIGGVNITCLE